MNNNQQKNQQQEDKFTPNAFLVTFILLVVYVLYDLFDWSRLKLLFM